MRPEGRSRRPGWLPLARVEGASMLPTLRAGDVVATLPALGRVRRGEVVLLRRGGVLLVKRVAAGPGDVVEMTAGRLRVLPGGHGADPASGPGARWAVPPGSYFVVGDAAAASSDSRTWPDPYVARADILGRVRRRIARAGADAR